MINLKQRVDFGFDAFTMVILSVCFKFQIKKRKNEEERYWHDFKINSLY